MCKELWVGSIASYILLWLVASSANLWRRLYSGTHGCGKISVCDGEHDMAMKHGANKYIYVSLVSRAQMSVYMQYFVIASHMTNMLLYIIQFLEPWSSSNGCKQQHYRGHFSFCTIMLSHGY